MSEAAVAYEIPDEVQYQYNDAGTIRAPINSAYEVMLQVKWVQEPYATKEFLDQLGGPAAAAREAGFVLSFKDAKSLGIETLHEPTGQWRKVTSTTNFCVVAVLP